MSKPLDESDVIDFLVNRMKVDDSDATSAVEIIEDENYAVITLMGLSPLEYPDGPQKNYENPECYTDAVCDLIGKVDELTEAAKKWFPGYSVEETETWYNDLDEELPYQIKIHWKPDERDDANHVVVDFNDGAFRCNHCGNRYLMRLPCPVNVWVAASNAYVEMHQDCPPPKPLPKD